MKAYSFSLVCMFAAVGITLMRPRTAQAQGCDQLNPNAEVTTTDAGLPTQRTTGKNTHLKCPGGKELWSDELGVINITGIYTLNKNVRYRDGDKEVTADFGQYFSKTALFQARGNVVVTDLKSRSRLSAPALDYYQVSPTNKVARVMTSSGRAHAVLHQKPDSTSARTPTDSSIVDADVIEIIGEKTFRGTGAAIITRTDMRGYGDFVEYDQDAGDLLLAQAARVEADKYKLMADTIRAVAAEGQQIKEVRASRDAVLTSEQARVESPFLRIFLDSGQVNRMVATRPLSRPGQPVSLPRVLSKTFNVSADSIDASAPHQLLERVDAVGRAFGERIDTLPPPPAAKEMPDVLTNDWLRGDTLHATFVANPDAKPDSTGKTTDRMLQQIIAVGQTASSAIRMQQPKDSTWKIHYTLADHITVDFVKGAAPNVVLEGNVHGLYLTPLNSATPVVPRRPGGGQ